MTGNRAVAKAVPIDNRHGIVKLCSFCHDRNKSAGGQGIGQKLVLRPPSRTRRECAR
jgi:hypothetical protein